MSVRMNGFRGERENRPSSETMVELHVYLVPPDIWREKFNNALNQNINDTVSIGLIRVHPETKVFALREEIEQQLGSSRVPRKYVFLKSVGRSLTRLKSKQEVTLKAKNFLPPQAYAPEVYLLEATPEVQQAFNSEDSTQPQTPTSYDYEFPAGNKNAKGRSNQYPFNGRFTPETYRENEPLDRRKTEQDVVNDQLKPLPPPPEADDEESDQLYKPQDDQDLLQWNRRQQEDQETARREEEKRAREEALRKKLENDHQQIAKDAKLMKTVFDEDLTRFPSPPPLRLASPDKNANLAGAQRKKQKDELLRELEEAKAERRASERQREDLVKHAKQMQAKTQNKRNHARDYWKKRYFDEKKKTEPLEEQNNGLRTELDIFHKRLLAILEGPKEKATKLNDPKGNSKVGFPSRPLVSSNFQSNTHSLLPANGGKGQTHENGNQFVHYFTSLVPTQEVSSPTRERSESPDRTNRNSFTAQISPLLDTVTRIDQSQFGGFTHKAPVMSSRKLSVFKNEYIRTRRENKPYPVELIGSDNQKRWRLFDHEEIDSDYDSNQSSAKSNLNVNNSRKSKISTRKNVQFEQKVNYYTTKGHITSN